MEKSENRAIIQYLLKKQMSANEIYEDMRRTLNNDGPSYATVCRWINEFKRGRTSIPDEYRSGRPKTATTPEIIDKVRGIILNDRRLKLSEVAEMLDISKERVHFILTEELDMHKLSARWVPRLLSDEHKRIRCELSAAGLKEFNTNEVRFLKHFITMDETWVHYHTPETKNQSKQWTRRGSPAPKKALIRPSAGKIMASIFWDSTGVLLIDYLGKGQTINSAYYSDLLDQLKAAIRKKRPRLSMNKILYHHDNAPVHSSVCVAQKLAKLKFNVIAHPPYSPDLAPSDYYLFPNLKKNLAGKKFTSNEEVTTFVNEYFESLDKNYFKVGIQKLQHRWAKCIELQGDYVEK